MPSRSCVRSSGIACRPGGGGGAAEAVDAAAPRCSECAAACPVEDAPSPAAAGSRSRWRRPRTRRRRSRCPVARTARGIRQAAGRDRRQVPAGGPRQREGLRESHRLRGEAHRHRSRRHFVGLRWRRRHRRLEQRGGSVQRHAGTGAPRLHGSNRSASCGAAICCAFGAKSRRSPKNCGRARTVRSSGGG